MGYGGRKGGLNPPQNDSRRPMAEITLQTKQICGKLLAKVAQDNVQATGDLSLLSAEHNPEVKEAMRLLREAEQGFHSLCGDRSLQRIGATIAIADSLLTLQRHEEARLKYESVLPVAQDVFGDSHAQVNHIKANLASARGLQGSSSSEQDETIRLKLGC